MERFFWWSLMKSHEMCGIWESWVTSNPHACWAYSTTRMHSSRMRTGRSLTVCWSLLPGGGVCSRGVYPSMYWGRHPSSPLWTDRRLWKYYLGPTSLRPVMKRILMYRSKNLGDQPPRNHRCFFQVVRASGFSKVWPLHMPTPCTYSQLVSRAWWQVKL